MCESQFVKVVGAVAVSFAIAACTNSGGAGAAGGRGGGGGSPSTPAGYDAKIAEIQKIVPTSDMPEALSARFVGMTKQDMYSTSSGGIVGAVMADLDLQVDWQDGVDNNPWSGKANNFRGTLDGKDFAIDGELTVENAEAKSLPNTVGRTFTPASTIALPTGGTVNVPATATGAATIALSGPLELDGQQGDVLLSLGGTFLGSGGQVLHGPAQGTWFGQSTGTVGAPYTSAGTFYAEKQ